MNVSDDKYFEYLRIKASLDKPVNQLSKDDLQTLDYCEIYIRAWEDKYLPF